MQPARSRRQTYGLPTGIGDDIRARVERQAESLHPQHQAQRQPEPAPIILQAPDNRVK